MDTAWCLTCADIYVHPIDWLGIALESPDMRDTFTTDRGVRFWTPARHYKDGLVEQFLEQRRRQRELTAVSDAEDKWAQDALTIHDRRLRRSASTATE